MNTATTTDVAKRPQQDVANQAQTRLQESSLQPPVDIFEDTDGITLEADMPGVTKDGLNVHVEGENLIVEGKIKLELPQGAQALHADVRSTTLKCSFVLSRELESDKISAQLKDGVLQLRIPKRQEVKPRRIEVNT